MRSYTFLLVAVCFVILEVTSSLTTECIIENETCHAGGDCCSGICDLNLGTCTKPEEAEKLCLPLNVGCKYPDDCCSTVCFNNVCIPTDVVLLEFEEAEEK